MLEGGVDGLVISNTTTARPPGLASPAAHEAGGLSGRPLFGHYEVDREGVVPKPLRLVEKGALKSYLLTRQPVRGFEGSNGRARMPGGFGASTASFSNLFVRASETTPVADLKKKLIELCAARSKPYGIIVRKMDFPSSASLDEARRQDRAVIASGGRHAMGGQQFGSQAMLLDMKDFNHVVRFDRAKGQITVEAGIEWPELIDYLAAEQAGQAASWAIRFYQRHGFELVGDAEKTRLLERYWSIPGRQVETSVVLADQRYRENAPARHHHGGVFAPSSPAPLSWRTT